jgi:hypothetical protein
MFPPNVIILAATAICEGATASFTNHIDTVTGKMPAVRKKACPECGVLVGHGWGWHHHMKSHVKEDGDGSEDDSDGSEALCSDATDEDGSAYADDDCCMEALPGAAKYGRWGKVSVVEYLETLSMEERLCPEHVMQYMLWCKRRTTDEGTLKTFLFLRAMYGGTGASRRQGQEMLQFLHSMGVLPAGMPSQIRDCWSLVTKVQLECLRNICAVHYKCTFEML